jgi:hypothetical protein
MNGLDDLGVVDSSQVRGGDSEFGVPELALDHCEWDAFSGHLNVVCVPELMGREPPSDPCGSGSAM